MIFLIFFSFLISSGFSQNKADTLIPGEISECESIAYNASNLIRYFYSVQDLDSVEIVLNGWESACGNCEPIVRTRILLAIYRNHFSEALYDSTIIDYVLDYINRMEISATDDTYTDYPDYFGYIPIRGDYDFFTQSIADTLLKRIFYNPAELYFSELYSNVLAKPMEEISHDSIYQNTAIKLYYDHRINKYRYKPDYHMSMMSGIWIPFDNASLLGIHPLIGFQAGFRSKKMTYNLTLAFRFVESKNEYEILLDGNSVKTNTFFGGYIAADIERDILKLGKNEFDLLGGVGYDGFDAVNVNTEDDDPDNDVSHSINSVNINFGLGYRHYMRDKRYIGLQGKYNF